MRKREIPWQIIENILTDSDVEEYDGHLERSDYT